MATIWLLDIEAELFSSEALFQYAYSCWLGAFWFDLGLKLVLVDLTTDYQYNRYIQLTWSSSWPYAQRSSGNWHIQEKAYQWPNLKTSWPIIYDVPQQEDWYRLSTPILLNCWLCFLSTIWWACWFSNIVSSLVWSWGSCINTIDAYRVGLERMRTCEWAWYRRVVESWLVVSSPNTTATWCHGEHSKNSISLTTQLKAHNPPSTSPVQVMKAINLFTLSTEVQKTKLCWILPDLGWQWGVETRRGRNEHALKSQSPIMHSLRLSRSDRMEKSHSQV